MTTEGRQPAPEPGAGGADELVRTVVDLLGAVDRPSVPAVEVMVVDAVASWLISDVNPGSGYTEEHAGQLLSMVLGSLGDAGSVDLDRAPGDDGSIGAARDRIVAGAHELAALGEQGVTRLLHRSTPALVGELTEHEGHVAAQLRSAYVYPLFAIATGAAEQGEEAVMRGLAESYAAWNTQLAEGWVVPWRRA